MSIFCIFPFIFNGNYCGVNYFSVPLLGVRGHHEGLVHKSQLRKEGRVRDVGDVVRRGQRVKVKLLGITGTKMSLSMKVSVWGVRV